MYTIKERQYVEQIEKAYSYASKLLLDLLMDEYQLMDRLRQVLFMSLSFFRVIYAKQNREMVVNLELTSARCLIHTIINNRSFVLTNICD